MGSYQKKEWESATCRHLVSFVNPVSRNENLQLVIGVGAIDRVQAAIGFDAEQAFDLVTVDVREKLANALVVVVYATGRADHDDDHFLV